MASGTTSSSPRQQLSKRKYQDLERYKEQMHNNGWCQHRVDSLAKTYKLKTFAYLSALKSRRCEYGRCKGETCVVHNVNHKTYRTRHVAEDCQCHEVGAPYEDLRRILSRGGIPLMSIQQNDDSTYQVRVQERKRHSRYIAISHVWADGLGNPNSCTLPSCQLKEIQASLSAFAYHGCYKEPPLLWMDTLCIPVKAEDRRLRTAQIDKMASIYQGADYSLVLDAELMAISPFSLCETYARIACSAWASRSWPLQEAILPPRIAVQFARGTIVIFSNEPLTPYITPRLRILSTLIARPPVQNWFRERRLDVSTIWIPEHMADESEQQTACGDDLPLDNGGVVLADLQEQFYQTWWPTTRDSDFDIWWPSTSFSLAWNQLACRSTTQADDVPLIISNILSLVNTHLLKYKEPEDRYLAILLGTAVPLSLFSNTGPRCFAEDQRLNKWVPTCISKELLTSPITLEVWKDYLFLRHYGRDDDDFSLYIVQAEDLASGKSWIQMSNKNTLYKMERPDLCPGNVDVGKSGQICIVLEREKDRSEWPYVRRGSYFSVVKRGGGRAQTCWRRQRFASLTLEFRGPLRFRDALESSPTATDEIIQATRVVEYTDMKVLYNKPKGVKPLTSRSVTRMELGFTMTLSRWFLQLALMAPLVPLGMFIWRLEKYHIESIIFIVVFVIMDFMVGKLVATWIVGHCEPLFESVIEWWHTRSYEKIIRQLKLEPQGEV